MLIKWLLLFPLVLAAPEFTIVILSQPAEYDSKLAESLKASLEKQANDIKKSPNVLIYDGKASQQWGYWGILAIINQLREKYRTSPWFLFINSHSEVVLPHLYEFVTSKNSSELQYFGHDVEDQKPTIIHHYYGFEYEGEPFFFPDYSQGLLISNGLMKKISNSLSSNEATINQFTIDPGHEIAKFVFVNHGFVISGAKETFCPKFGPKCAVYFKKPTFDCPSNLRENNIRAYVKTFSGYHDSRLRVVQKTWGPHFSFIDYVSDIESSKPRTITVGVNNTERGHCGKTFGILKRFLTPIDQGFNWLLIADDDTLLSVDRLVKLLSCYDHNESLIIGERYGYGFGYQAYIGYDYPTGGSGMIFSRKAVEQLVKNCRCPGNSSPDDMIIGMCARAYKVPILHSAALHQAQYNDYPEVYIKKLKPISFHKFINVDPIWVYNNILVDADETPVVEDKGPAEDTLREEL